MAIRLIESFDWTIGAGSVSSDLAGRYNISAGSTPGLVTSPGRFGGNYYSIGGSQFISFQLKGGPFGPRIVLGFAVLCEGTAGAASPLIEFWDGLFGSGGTAQISLGVDAGMHLQAFAGNMGAALGPAGPTALAFNSYFYVEIEVLIAAALGGSFKCNLDGITQFNLGGITTQQSALSQMTHLMLLGNHLGQNTHFDDMYLKDTTGMLGPSRVTLKKPNGDGALSQWTPSAAGPHFSLVNEIPEDGDGTFVSDATVGHIDLYTFTALGQTPANIFGVQVSLNARKDDAAARSLATEVRSGGANFTGVTQATTTTYLDVYTQIYEQDPNTAAAWTLAGVDAAQFGVQTIA
jgi:hypothetical protein